MEEFTRDRFPNGPKCGVVPGHPMVIDILSEQQLSDLNEALFTMCEELEAKYRTQGLLEQKDIGDASGASTVAMLFGDDDLVLPPYVHVHCLLTMLSCDYRE